MNADKFFDECREDIRKAEDKTIETGDQKFFAEALCECLKKFLDYKLHTERCEPLRKEKWVTKTEFNEEKKK